MTLRKISGLLWWTFVITALLFAFFWQMTRSGAPTVLDPLLGIHATAGPMAGSTAGLILTIAALLTAASSGIAFVVTTIALAVRWVTRLRRPGDESSSGDDHATAA